MHVEASAGARPATSTLNGDAAVFVFTAGVDATSSWPSMATAAAISVAKRRAQKATARSQGVLGHPANAAACSQADIFMSYLHDSRQAKAGGL